MELYFLSHRLPKKKKNPRARKKMHKDPFPEPQRKDSPVNTLIVHSLVSRTRMK